MTPEQKSALESAIAHFERNGFWEAAELRGILDEEARRTVSGQEGVAFPEIKGAWIDGGYVIVTPAGIGNAPALKEAILKAAAPIPATVSGQEAVAVVGPRIGDLMANPIRWTDMKAMDSLPIGTKLYAIPETEQTTERGSKC